MAYTTSSNVSNELNGLALNSTSTPTSTIVTGWITEADREIDLRTGQVWSSTTASSEYYDYDGSGLLRLSNTPVISITELLAESNGINASVEGWYSLTEGRLVNHDYILYTGEGEIMFHGTRMPNAGLQNISVSYTYGVATTPSDIQRLSTLIAAKRIIQTILGGSATTEGGTVSVGTITVSDPSEFGNKRLKAINEEINSLFNKVTGTLKTYRLNRNY